MHLPIPTWDDIAAIIESLGVRGTVGVLGALTSAVTVYLEASGATSLTETEFAAAVVTSGAVAIAAVIGRTVRG